MANLRFVMALAAVLAVSHPVTAHAIAVNPPTGDWTIGPINAPSSSGVGYCSMKNSYRDGHTLVFARDAEGSNSLAIDFRSKTLKIGAQYTVGLEVGLLQRQMVAIAATPSVLIIQMGLDRDFYTMLQRKENLFVSFTGKRLSFRLDGTGDGLAALTDCARAIGSGKKFSPTRVTVKTAAKDEADVAAVEPAAGTFLPVPAAPVHAVAPEEMSLGAQVATESLKDEIARLKAENRRLLLENQAVAERLQAEDEARKLAISIENDRLKEEVSSLQQQQDLTLAETRAQLRRELAAENEKIKAELAAALQQEKERALAEARAQLAAVVANPATVPSKSPALEISRSEITAAPPAPKTETRKPGLVDELLARAGIQGQRQPRNPAVYTWTDGNIFGAAEERQLSGIGSLEKAVEDYVRTAGTRCKGDFAHTLSAAKPTGTFKTLEGELACIDGRNDAAAAVLFVGTQDRLAVITHEGPAADITRSLAGREAVLAGITR